MLTPSFRPRAVSESDEQYRAALYWYIWRMNFSENNLRRAIVHELSTPIGEVSK